MRIVLREGNVYLMHHIITRNPKKPSLGYPHSFFLLDLLKKLPPTCVGELGSVERQRSILANAYLASFSLDTLTGRLPSNRVGLMPCSVMMILAFSRKEVSIISIRLRAWALPIKY